MPEGGDEPDGWTQAPGLGPRLIDVALGYYRQRLDEANVGICRIWSEFVGFNLIKIKEFLIFMLAVEGLLD